MMRDSFLGLLVIAVAYTLGAYAIGFVWIGRRDARQRAARRRALLELRPMPERPPARALDEGEGEERMA